MKKKVLLVLTTTILAITAVGCNSSREDSTESFSSQPSSITNTSSELSATSQTSSESRATSSEASSASSNSQSSSSQSTSSTQNIIREITVEVPKYVDETKHYDFTFEYSDNDALFASPSHTFNRYLADFAFGNAVANQNKTKINKFYTDAGFDHIALSDSYDTEPTETSIGYAFAHKKHFNGTEDIVFVSMRGFDYKREWADNFNMGASGEHAGFAARADIVNVALKEYMTTNGYIKNKTYVLVNGYSRAGAVANLLAKRLNDEEIVANKEKIYTYTFEAPQGALEKGEYNNIFNIINRGDIITYFAPIQYGFTRYGSDIYIDSEDVDLLVNDFDPEINLPAFSVDTGSYENDMELANYIVNSIVSYEQASDDTSKSAQTREEFANNYQVAIGYALALYFSLKKETTDAIKTGIESLDIWGKLGLLAEDGLYNFLKPYIDEDGFVYESEDLRTHCNTALEFMEGPGVNILGLALNSNNPMSRAILLHTPEINYTLMKNRLPLLYN